MKTAVKLDRRTILSLIAMGRMTPQEAEQLLTVSEHSDDAILTFAMGFAIAGIALSLVHEWMTVCVQMCGGGVQ